MTSDGLELDGEDEVVCRKRLMRVGPRAITPVSGDTRYRSARSPG